MPRFEHGPFRTNKRSNRGAILLNQGLNLSGRGCLIILKLYPIISNQFARFIIIKIIGSEDCEYYTMERASECACCLPSRKMKPQKLPSRKIHIKRERTRLLRCQIFRELWNKFSEPSITRECPFANVTSEVANIILLFQVYNFFIF